MKRILVDSSIWIEFFRNKKAKNNGTLKELLNDDNVIFTSIIKAEILSGAQSEKHFRTLQEILSAIPILEEPPDFWDILAYDRFRLSRQGIHVSIPDLSIGVLATLHHAPIYTKDRIFRAMQKVLPFELVK